MPHSRSEAATTRGGYYARRLLREATTTHAARVLTPVLPDQDDLVDPKHVRLDRIGVGADNPRGQRVFACGQLVDTERNGPGRNNTLVVQINLRPNFLSVKRQLHNGVVDGLRQFDNQLVAAGFLGLEQNIERVAWLGTGSPQLVVVLPFAGLVSGHALLLHGPVRVSKYPESGAARRRHDVVSQPLFHQCWENRIVV